jgi:hypothetical protein
MSIGDVLWRRVGAPATINPQEHFDTYEKAIIAIERGPPSVDDPKLLAQSWKMFDNEAARRGTIDARAAALMPALGLAATLVTGVGFTVLKDATIFVGARWIVLATLVLALVYLTRTTVLLFDIHGQVFRSTLDPSDLPTVNRDPADTTASPYDRLVACKVLRYTVWNYRANNVQSQTLFVAQGAFRNAVIVIVAGGALATISMFAASFCEHAAMASLLGD